MTQRLPESPRKTGLHPRAASCRGSSAADQRIPCSRSVSAASSPPARRTAVTVDGSNKCRRRHPKEVPAFNRFCRRCRNVAFDNVESCFGKVSMRAVVEGRWKPSAWFVTQWPSDVEEPESRGSSAIMETWPACSWSDGAERRPAGAGESAAIRCRGRHRQCYRHAEVEASRPGVTSVMPPVGIAMQMVMRLPVPSSM